MNEHDNNHDSASLVKLSGWVNEGDSWKYYYADNACCKDGWFWIDENRDGIAECYYFNSTGEMYKDMIVDGSELNIDGQWELDSMVQTIETSPGACIRSMERASVIERRAELMVQNGFEPYSGEWWHYKDSEDYPVIESFP